ncbi:uncharacterized protein LOC121863698 [Homarus americanus]|uniref:uncharacterized protein LOC121863698 n=1 Tax=Homarus americanus TaxID=6706 RepID=UPI001C473A6C|nr:uncharacterized protein LOC121863698 [Homarus americanus]
MATTETTKSAGPQNNITETYVEKVLKADKGNDAQLTSWSIKDFTQKGDNYATVVTSVSVNFSLHGQNQSVSYVVKINPQRDLGKDFSDMFGAIFRKEAEFYEKIIPLLNSELTTLGLRQLRMAKWYYSFLEEGREMIFLEDLRPRGYQMFDRRKGMDVPHATLVLQELARMHAASRFLQARTPDQDLLDKFKTIKTDWLNCTDSGGQMFHNMISTHFSIAEELLHKVEGYEVAEQWIIKNKGDCSSILASQLMRNAKFDVICHGDCWNNNLLFRYNEVGDPVEVILLDLQMNRVASLATDLNYLLYTSLHGKDRKAHVYDYLASYYEAFTKVMEAGGKDSTFTLPELHQEYKNKQEYGVIFGLFTVGVMLAEGNDIPDMDEFKEVEIPKLMEVLRQRTHELIESNPLFRSRFLAVFDEMNEEGTTT